MKNKNEFYYLINWLMVYKIFFSFHYVSSHTYSVAKMFSCFVKMILYYS
ncbi:hypothetical protein [Candidatus Purcelliella pentastirinorum]|nr:hypothetical protein [Candidatus Purcelliella pentastirinorum]